MSPDELPAGHVGEAYDVRIWAERGWMLIGDTGPVGGINLEYGSLPPGLELVFDKPDETAALHGTPIERGAFEFRVGAWSYGTMFPGQRGTHDYVLTID